MTSRRILSAVGAVIVAVVLAVVLMRCSGDDTVVAPAEEESPIDYTGALEGMRGTRPVAVACGTVGARCGEDQNPEWAKQLNDFWISIGNEPLESYEYASEAFDSVIVAALAAEAAGTDGSALADQVIGLTRDGKKCTEFAECLALLKEGVDIDYDGKSGKFTMNGLGEVVESNYAVVEFGSNNRIDPDRTEYRELTATWAFVPRPEPIRTRLGDGVLKIGSLLPLTGQLAPYGPPQFAGVEYAVAVINEAGGVLGNEVEYVQGDCGDTSTLKAENTVERLLAENVDVIVGPSSTAVTKNVIETILGAGIVQFSPANTNMELVGFEDNGLYFRAAPADDVQTYLLGLVLDEDNASRVHIVHSDDLYGTSVSDRLQIVLKQRGIEVVAVTPYDIAAGSYTDVVDALIKSDTDTIVTIGFDEVARLLREMVTANIGPKFRKVYGVDAIMGDALGENFDVQS
ncbi:MAG: ABC transporter substrate-binding protein [Actinomycetota bacterium]